MYFAVPQCTRMNFTVLKWISAWFDAHQHIWMHLNAVKRKSSSNNHNQLSSIYLDLINVKWSIRLLAYKAMIINYKAWPQELLALKPN